jgi:hypothetical protein
MPVSGRQAAAGWPVELSLALTHDVRPNLISRTTGRLRPNTTLGPFARAHWLAAVEQCGRQRSACWLDSVP